MGRPAVTKGDVERVVKGAIAGGLEPGTFEVRLESGRVRLLPCVPVEPKNDAEPNPWDRIAPAA